MLFLASNPSDTTRLSTDEEYRAIQTRLAVARHRDRFELRYAPAVRAEEFVGVVRDARPTVVHFSGHGTREGEPLLPDAAGRAKAASPEAMAEVFALLVRETPLRCVVLNACYSAVLARALAAHVECVIGTSGALRDTVAITFAGAFYEALGAGLDVASA